MSADQSKYNKPPRDNKLSHTQLILGLGVASFCAFWYYRQLNTHIRAICKNQHIGDGKLLPTKRLNNGMDIPMLGLGTWEMGRVNGNGFEEGIIRNALTHAIKIGYRHIDCAQDYMNEVIIGDVLSDLFASNQISREELFITSKLNQAYHSKEHVRKQLLKTLKDLKLSYVDLFLIHWPFSFDFVDFDDDRRGYAHDYDSWSTTLKFPGTPLRETWQAMEELVDEGLVKSIGVSNFNVQLLYDLMTYARIKPVMNQIELHPYNQQTNLVKFCHFAGIEVTAYSPLGTPANKESSDAILLDDKVLNEIAKKYEVSAAQVALKWNIQRGVIVISKSNDVDRISENKSLHHFELSDEEMNRIKGLDKNLRYLRPENWGTTKNIPIFD